MLAQIATQARVLLGDNSVPFQGGRPFLRSNSQTGWRWPDWADRAASIRSASIAGDKGVSGKAFGLGRRLASASQKTGSRLIEVECPAIITERLTGPLTGRACPSGWKPPCLSHRDPSFRWDDARDLNTCAGRR